MSIYDDLVPVENIPELEGWQVTRGVSIVVDGNVYRISSGDKETSLGRGTGSCSWGWGVLLAPPKKSLFGTLAHSAVGMLYGLKDKLIG